MSRKVDLYLLPSSKMSNEGEHSRIRFPKRARMTFSFLDKTVVVGKGDSRTVLRVHKALRIDDQNLVALIREKKITTKDAKTVGFVSRAVYTRISKKPGASVWISADAGEITVGADPEFGLVSEHPGIGLSLVRGDTILKKEGEFGSDGPGVEVRPAPSTDHRLVVGNISNILCNPPGVVKPFKWRGGATFTDQHRTYWFGGHIHLGRPGTIDVEFAGYCYSKIAAVLDHLLAFPLLRFDTPNPEKRRNGCDYGYGKAGTGDTGDGDASIRTDYPEMDRFEYRVLSGLWLTHPTLARIVLGAAKCITETAYGRIADSKHDYDWVINAGNSKAGLLKSFGLSAQKPVVNAINANNASAVNTERLNIWERQIRGLDKFDDYKAELVSLIQLVKSDPHQVTKGLSLDVRSNWQDKGRLLKGSRTSKTLTTALEAVGD